MMRTTGNQSKLAFGRILKSKFVALGLLAFLAVGGVYSSQLMASDAEKATAPPARPAMPVETTEVKISASNHELLAVGSLHSNESVVIMPEIAGLVAKIAFKEGAAIQKGQLLIKLDGSVLQAQFDRAEASRALSEKNYQRAEALFNDNAISELERDESFSRWQLDEATSRLAKAQLDKVTITAPFAGTLGLRNVSVGDYVQPGRALVNLEDLSQLKIDFSVPEKFSSLVQVGQDVAITTDGHGEKRFVGQVYAINPLVDAKSRSLMVRGKIENSDGLLRPGQFAQVKLVTSSKAAAVFIPEQALIPQPVTPMVFTVVDGKAAIVPVQTGQRRKGWVEIVSGLVAGDVVITGGHQKIGPGSPVHAMPSDPSLFSAFESNDPSVTNNNG